MKKILLPLITISILMACKSEPEGFTINGTLTGDIKDSTRVFITKVGETKERINLDTAFIKNGKFKFTGNADSIPEMRYLFVDNFLGYTPLILENGQIELTGHRDSLTVATVRGTPQNEIFKDYLEGSRGIQGKAQSIQEDLKKARFGKDTATVISLQDEWTELQEEFKNFDIGFIKDNPNSLIGALLIDRALSQKLLEVQEVEEMYEALSPRIKNTEAGINISKNLRTLKEKEENGKKTAIGVKAPNFSAPTPSGEQLALNDVLGKVTLVDFWAAWCRPCRAENPNIVRVYKKYHDKGLNVLGVSLDRKAEDWKKAIADDGLDWNHVSNVAYFNDPIAKLYNVDAIPAAFLLDENGIIVAKNLRGPALEHKVAELLN